MIENQIIEPKPNIEMKYLFFIIFVIFSSSVFSQKYDWIDYREWTEIPVKDDFGDVKKHKYVYKAESMSSPYKNIFLVDDGDKLTLFAYNRSGESVIEYFNNGDATIRVKYPDGGIKNFTGTFGLSRLSFIKMNSMKN